MNAVTGGRVVAVPTTRVLPEPFRAGLAPHRVDADRDTMPHREENAVAATMALSELVAPEDILLDMQADSKRTALGGVADRLACGAGRSQGAVLAALLRRERLGPTFIGGGVAMPHARLDGISDPAAAVSRLHRPVPFGTQDDDTVDLLVAVLWPETRMNEFGPALARIRRLLRRTELAAGLRRSMTAREAHALIASAEVTTGRCQARIEQFQAPPM